MPACARKLAACGLPRSTPTETFLLELDWLSLPLAAILHPLLEPAAGTAY